MSDLTTVATLLASSAREWHRRQCVAGLDVFALIDADQQAKPKWPTARLAASARETNLFAARTTNAEALAVGPRLQELTKDAPSTDRILQYVESQSAELPRYLLIASPLTLSALAARLQRRIDVDAAGEDMMLRFWDGRIFLALDHVLEPVTREALMGFGTEALVSDRRGGLLPVALTCPEHDPLQGRPCHLTRDDIKALGMAARPDAILGVLRQQTPEVLSTVGDTVRHALAMQQLDECLQRDLQSPRDQALALSLAIEHGADWWHHDDWSECVRNAQTGTLLKAYLQHLEAA